MLRSGLADGAARAAKYLVVGLANPGRRYMGTRHNIGGESVSRLAAELGIPLRQRSHKALWGKACLPRPQMEAAASPLAVTLARPRTYMNLSGDSVGRLVKAQDIPPARLLVVVDHMDLELGRIRLRPGGGTGGHNGMKSITQHLGSRNFPRLWIGIGRPPGNMDPALYVLQRFGRQEEREFVEPTQRLAGEAIVYWLHHGIEAAMNMYNRRS